MAKRPTYSISADDPDIKIFIQRYPDILESILVDKFKYLPGKEEGTWNSLALFKGEQFGEYIYHCLDHLRYIIGKWSPENISNIINLVNALEELDENIYPIILSGKRTASMFTSLPYDAEPICPIPGFPIFLGQEISGESFDGWVKTTLSCWEDLADDCVSINLPNKLIDTGSQSIIKRHHILGGFATYVIYIAIQQERQIYGTGAPLLPLIYKMIEQSIAWQQADKAERKDVKEVEIKKRQLESPDSFIFRQVSNGKNSQGLRGIDQDLFVKAWLFKLIEQRKNTGAAPYSAQELINMMSKKFPECADMPASTLANLLSNLKKPSYVSKKLKKFLSI